ncbi:MAG: DUF499 domain-containing protein [Desulfatibacillaceae bacterium]|nr:DUF499 domain-containing protein [Desulfatibacillaceae bacterium]
MTQAAPKPWAQTVLLHPDVLSEDFSEDIFALDLGPLADGSGSVPKVYREPERFFRASFVTSGQRILLKDVLSRLSGGQGARVLKLMTPFGGGKSHTLATVFHAATSRAALNTIPEGKELPDCPKANVAVFDGQFFDAVAGKELPGSQGWRALTLWGWIAWKLKGEAGYNLVREHDQTRVAPGGDTILTLLGDDPNLILLDEVLHYLISAGGVKAEQTTLRDETITFIQKLTVAVSNTKRTAMVFSLQSSKRESLDYVNLLQTIDHMAARKDQRREPVVDDEVLKVIQRRLIAQRPEENQTAPTAQAFQDVLARMRRAYATSESQAQEADEEANALYQRIQSAYPFHPALIDLMRERWAAIPDFQRTRGALRFLASCLRAAQKESSPRFLLGPGDIPMHDHEVRMAFFKEVGQQEDFKAVLEHDLIGANARVKKIDDRRERESATEVGKRSATRLATAILMYSFGGLKRGGDDDDYLPPGVTEFDLLAACVGPNLDSTTIQACLKELKDQCLYLHFDGTRYCFKKDPNVTLLVEQEADIVGRSNTRVDDKIKEMLEERLAGHREAIIWPKSSMDIPDKEPRFLIGYLPLDVAFKPKSEKEEISREFFEKHGDNHRKYRNGIALAMPSREQVPGLRRAIRYLTAVEQVEKRAKDHNLTDSQKSQLKERRRTEEAAVESAFLKLYPDVWLPRIEGGKMVCEIVAAGGRPLRSTLNDKKRAMIHERAMETLTEIQRKVFDKLNPAKIASSFNLGSGDNPVSGVRVADVVDGFFSFPGFTRLFSDKVIGRSVAKGVMDCVFGYYTGSPPSMGEDGTYQVNEAAVVFGKQVPEDEIDLEAGFLMLPEARPRPVAPAVPPDQPAPEPTVPPTPGQGPGPLPPDGTPPDVPPGQGARKRVSIHFAANRDKLFESWQAIANLADMAGTVSISIEANSEDGFDENKLRNAVLEPLEEADLIEVE